MHGLGVCFTATAFVCLSSTGWTASHYAIAESSALSVLSARYGIVVVLLLILVTVLGKWQRMSRGELAFHLLIGALCHALYLLGSMRALELGVSTAVIACINAIQPIASASLASVIYRERIQKKYCIGFAFGMLSVALVITETYFQSDLSTLVLALPFSTMLALSLGMVLSRQYEKNVRASRANRQPLVLILLLNTVGAVIVIVPLAAVSGELQWHFTRTEWSTIAWLSVVVSLGSYVLLLLLLRHNSAVRVSSLTYLIPPATLLQSYFLFGEAISLTDVFALCIASVAVYFIVSKSGQKSAQQNNFFNSTGLTKHRLLQDFQQHPNHGANLQNIYSLHISRYTGIMLTPAFSQTSLRCHSICADLAHQHRSKLFSFAGKHSHKLARINARQRLSVQRVIAKRLSIAYTIG